MVVILISICSAVIIFMTVYHLMKVFMIAYKRHEISFQKLIVFSASSFVVGLLFVFFLPFGYQKIFELIF